MKSESTKEINMNIFTETIKTADEAVEKLISRGILTPAGDIDCCVIAAELKEILDNEDLQKRLLDNKDIQELRKIPSSKKEEVLEEVRGVGITSWNLGRGYLPRWDITKKDFERALEKRFA